MKERFTLMMTNELHDKAMKQAAENEQTFSGYIASLIKKDIPQSAQQAARPPAIKPQRLTPDELAEYERRLMEKDSVI